MHRTDDGKCPDADFVRGTISPLYCSRSPRGRSGDGERVEDVRKPKSLKKQYEDQWSK